MEYENQPDLGFYRMGVSIPVPLWNKREGPIAEAEAALRQTQAFADIRRLEITGALERAYRLYEAASQQVSGLEKGALQEAEAALRALKRPSALVNAESLKSWMRSACCVACEPNI